MFRKQHCVHEYLEVEFFKHTHTLEAYCRKCGFVKPLNMLEAEKLLQLVQERDSTSDIPLKEKLNVFLKKDAVR